MKENKMKKLIRSIFSYELLCILALVLFIISLFWAGYQLSVDLAKLLVEQCLSTGLIMELPAKYVPNVGCFLQYNGMWLPKDQLVQVIVGH